MPVNAGYVGTGAFELARRRSSVLIITPAFPPVCGDLPAGIEELCVEFTKRGIVVTVATWETSDRLPADRSGIHIVPLRRDGDADGMPSWVAVIRRLVGSGLFSACILFADPTDACTWAFVNAAVPAATRFLVRLLLDRGEAMMVLKEPSLRRRLVDILRRATATLLLTRNGPDKQFVDAEGLPGIFVPQAVHPGGPAVNFREQQGIPRDAFVVLLPGEIGKVKNQLGLVQVLQGAGADWRIVFATPSPGGSAVENRFAAGLAGRSEYLYVAGLSQTEMAAAIEACDILVCASQQEHSPREIIMAMSHGKPWLAEADCALATDCAGGVSARLTDFRETLASLQRRPDLLSRLGENGRRHWKQCFSWDVAMDAWMGLVTSGKTAFTFDIPAGVEREKRELNQETAGAVRADRHSFVHSFPEQQEGFSFCIITDGREPDKLRLEIESIRAQHEKNSEIFVGGAVPPGFEDVYCVDMAEAARDGRLGFMRNRLVERARFGVVVVADDDMIFHPGFTKGIQMYPGDYDVLCVRILNTDGTRFWDWAVYGAPSGHHLIDYATNDPYVYVTGGMCIMRAYVPRLVQWSDRLVFYQFEDIDFSRRINARGLRIRFCRESVVTHNDERYYGNNYQVGKRTDPPLPPPPSGAFVPPGTGGDLSAKKIT
jgi:glycosyltransferase involved in cell wall biosynthesis